MRLQGENPNTVYGMLGELIDTDVQVDTSLHKILFLWDQVYELFLQSDSSPIIATASQKSFYLEAGREGIPYALASSIAQIILSEDGEDGAISSS